MNCAACASAGRGAPLGAPAARTTRTYTGQADVDGITIEFMPVAVHCCNIARDLLRGG